MKIAISSKGKKNRRKYGFKIWKSGIFYYLRFRKR